MDNILGSIGRNEGQIKARLLGIRLTDIHVDCVAKIAEFELAEKEKMKEKIKLTLKYNSTIFINRIKLRE
ncbi:hypothetical protein OUZ56_010097 [Daphnia magna]|uniref:Uncharacterized protein n=1 Tax=Daphnia magna TaxID=35525 RepID=A0ABR0AHR9_9CRUS|nr:hypothetical protein OUZ56_010097 [Daphnia magna]